MQTVLTDIEQLRLDLPNVGFTVVENQARFIEAAVQEVEEAAFSDVSAEFAHAEGEGDRTLEWWRKAHWAYFSRECAGVGIEPSEDMVLVLERFQVVHP